MRYLLFVLVVVAWISCVRADDNAGFEIMLPDAKINSGEDYPVLCPSQTVTWADPEPFAPEQDVVFWYPYEDMPLVSEIVGENHSDRIVAGDVLALQDDEWIKVADLQGSFDVRNNVRQILHVKFAQPVRARGFRLHIAKVEDRDYDVTRLLGITFRGKAEKQVRVFPQDGMRVRIPAEWNVVDLPQAANVEVALSSPQGGEYEMEVQVRPVNYGAASVCRQMMSLALTPNVSQTQTISFAGLHQGPHMATVLLRKPGSTVVVTARRVLFGVRDPEIGRTGKVIPLDHPGKPLTSVMEIVRRDGCLWGFDATQGMAGMSRSPQSGFFRQMRQAGGRVAFCALSYQEFEPFPGVYNFAYFDHVVQNARETGMLLTLGMWWWDFGKTPEQWWLQDAMTQVPEQESRWNKNSWQSRTLSQFSQKFRTHAKAAVQAMVKRYLNSPEVILWHPHPYGMVDHDACGIYDVHPEALAAWKTYLSARYKEIGALNQAYGKSYKAWSDVPVPLPAWDQLVQAEQWQQAGRVLDLRSEWIDWLDFYHGRVLDTRTEMMEAVREIDGSRSFPGMNASGGVGKADGVYATLAQHKAFYGDQGLNGVELFRRTVAASRYGLPLRLEDISSLIPGKGGVSDADAIVDRTNWDLFQLGAIAPEHFNYVFPAKGGDGKGEGNYFFHEAFSSAAMRQMVADARAAKLKRQPVALLHSFLTDIYEGKYKFSGISLQRWWRMEGWSQATYAPGMLCEFYSGGCPRPDLMRSTLIIDDGSRVMPVALSDDLVSYVENGGKLALMGGIAGEASLPQSEHFSLLRRLGFGDADAMAEPEMEPGQLVFLKDNPVCRRVVSVPLQYWRELSVPENGKAIGRIGAKVAAVWWRFGKGEVVLLGGIPGAIPEGKVLQMMSNRDPKDKDAETALWDSWHNAERDCAATASALLADLTDWAGVKPFYSVSGEMLSVMRESDAGVNVYLYNQGHAEVPVLRIPGLASGSYQILTLRVEEKQPQPLLTTTAQALSAPGVALPELGHHRFMAVTIRRVE